MAFKKKKTKSTKNHYLVISLLGLLLVSMILYSSKQFIDTKARAATSTFVTRSGNTLSLNGKPFRFAGANIYWLGLDENVNSVNYPTKFRTDDALATAKEMGATVIRSHTLGISVGCALCIKPTLTEYNDAAFNSIDYAIASAKNKDLRLIIPLTDNWNYFHGGKKTFTDWRGLSSEEEFYTNPQVIEDYKAYITYILTHVNQYTGVALKDEPTILAWETGNELRSAPTEWTKLIAEHIKSIDPKHLVADGRDVKGDFRNLDISSVDLYTDHFYPLNNNQMKVDAAAVVTKNKVFYIGEYDWTDNSAKKPQASIAQDTSTKVNGSRSAKITITQPGKDWDIQLMQGNRSLIGNVNNTVEFWAKASAQRNIRVVLQKNTDPWTMYVEKTFTLTTSWQKYSLSVMPSASDNNVLLAVNVGESGGTVWLDTMSLTGLTSTNSLQNASFETVNGSSFASWNFTVNDPSVDPLNTFLPFVENKANGITGSLYWSLFGHKDDYGYVQHSDTYTLHYPGDTPDMTTKAQQLRTHAYNMQGIAAPSHRCPNAPILQPLTGKTNSVSVAWRGSVGAKTYTIQRSTNSGSSWQTVKTGLTDNNAPWIDTTGRLNYKYRVQGINAANIAGAFSDGTATVSCKTTSSNP